MTEYSILYNLKEYHAKKISAKVIRTLKQLKGDSLLESSDHGLKNTWEEICVQLQEVESVFWNAYDETVEQTINFVFKKVDNEILKFLSIMSDDEFYVTEKDDFKYEDYPYCSDSACNIVKKEIYSRARMFTNNNIKRYLDNHTIK